MKKYIIVLLGFLVLTPYLNAAGQNSLLLKEIDVSLKDKLPLQRGAKLFVNYCLSCHSMDYMRYSRLAEDLGIPEDVVVDNMMFGNDKIGSAMTNTMTESDGEKWFGVAPPDLSLIARLRGESWLYSYLSSFYRDQSTSSGWNNAIFANVAMPHVMSDLQGEQTPILSKNSSGANEIVGFKQTSVGKMSTEEFDEAMKDLTHFLVYASEPSRMTRERYGLWVILFSMLFCAAAYLLKKEYWKDV